MNLKKYEAFARAAELGWTCRTELEDGIRMTYEDYLLRLRKQETEDRD